jgi:hypothetical protein
MLILAVRSLCGVMIAACAFAQTTGTATITGAVTDPTGAAIAGAVVTATNTQMQFVSKTSTTAEGTYYLPYLTPGTYRLTIQAAGFRQLIRDGIVLRTNETPRIDVQLELGNVSETVTVTAAPPLLETETAASGQILEGENLVKIPVLQKAMYRIHLYMPGVNSVGGISVVGQRQRQMGYTLDGVSAKAPVEANPNALDGVMTSSLDAIQDVAVIQHALQDVRERLREGSPASW